MRQIIIILLVLCWCTLPAPVLSASNDTREEAYELYSKGYDLYAGAEDDSSLQSAESAFMRARALVSRDTDNLRYSKSENKVVPGTGRWPKYERVTINYNKSYKPNKYLRTIRNQIPPGFNVSSWRANNQLYVRVVNTGKARVEKLEVSFVAGRNSRSAMIDELLPNRGKVVKFPGTFKGRMKDVTINFGERYDFVPAQMRY